MLHLLSFEIQSTHKKAALLQKTKQKAEIHF